MEYIPHHIDGLVQDCSDVDLVTLFQHHNSSLDLSKLHIHLIVKCPINMKPGNGENNLFYEKSFRPNITPFISKCPYHATNRQLD